MQAVLLVGGFGTRLRPLTYRVPKPMVPVMGKPLMMHVIDALPSEVDQIIIPVNYKRDMVEEFIAQNSLPVEITIVDEPDPMGTGGAVKNVENLITRDGTFLVLNGDIVASIDLADFVAFHKAKGGIASISLWEVEDPTPFGVAQLDDNAKIIRFQEKPKRQEAFSRLINAGAYALEPEVLDEIGPGFVSMEREVFPKLLSKGMYGFAFEGFWTDCGTREGVVEAHSALMELHGSYVAESAFTYNTNLMRPFCIEPDCRIVNSIIGPSTYIGAGSVVMDDCEVINSVLLPGSRVGRDCRLENCIVDEKYNIPHGTKIRDMILAEEPQDPND